MVSTKKRYSSRYALTALCVCAMLTALYVVLNRFVSIPISSGIKIGFPWWRPSWPALFTAQSRVLLSMGSAI